MFVSGIVSLSSVLLYTYLPDLLSTIIGSQLVLRDGDESMLFQLWIKTPVPVDYEFYFFQINNPKEVLRGNKPRISQVGPFCFKQYRTKKVVGWGENGETVKYLEYKNNVFSPEGEGCKSTLDEEVTVINPPIAALGATIADIVRAKVPLTAITSPIIMSSVSALMTAHQQNMFMKRTARDILLGFRINLLDTVTALIRPLEMLGYRKEDLLPGGGLPNNTFGLLYGKNNTPEGQPYEVYTGVGKNAQHRFVHTAKYKNKPALPFWKSQYCNQVRGSDGSMFGAGVKRSDKLWAFSADICRSIYLSYMRDGEFKGIPTYVFGIDDTVFGNSIIEPRNECFCVHPESLEHRCAISGTFDIGACQGGAPLIISKPQFLSTDPDLSQGVEGFAPNKNDHDSVVEIEPLTGIAVNGVKKLQFSLRVENVPFLRGFNNMKNVTYIPFAVAVEKGSLPDDLADIMREFVFSPLKFIYWGLLGTAGVAAIFAGRSGFRRFMDSNRTRKLRNSAKNLYKKRSNIVDSEISSIKSTTELIPRTGEDIATNTTNVKLHLRNGNELHSNRLQQLSASRLQPFYMNGGQAMSYFPQIIPIVMPFPYSMNQDKHQSNNAPMITTLNSTPTQNDYARRRPTNFMPYGVRKSPQINLNSISNSINPAVYSNSRTVTSTIKQLSENAHQARSNMNLINQSNIHSEFQSTPKPYELARKIQIESMIESVVHERESENDDEMRLNSALTEENENMNNFDYNSADDQFYYYYREEHEPLSDRANEMKVVQVNDEYIEANLNEIDDQVESMSINRQQQMKSDYDQKNLNTNESKQTHDDTKRIKRLGYDYDFYD